MTSRAMPSNAPNIATVRAAISVFIRFLSIHIFYTPTMGVSSVCLWITQLDIHRLSTDNKKNSRRLFPPPILSRELGKVYKNRPLVKPRASARGASGRPGRKSSALPGIVRNPPLAVFLPEFFVETP